MWNDDKLMISDFNEIRTAPPYVCPLCGEKSRHIYLNRYKNTVHGGVWEWCDNCKEYSHGSCVIPVWWKNLDTIESAKLCAEPDYLNNYCKEIDKWVAKLIEKRINNKELRLQEYNDCLSDIEIAKQYISDALLMPSEAIADFYFLPSGNRHTFYAILYKENGKHKLVYATNVIYNCNCDTPIYEYSFSDCVDAMKHPAKQGNITVEIKNIPYSEAETIMGILDSLPEKFIFDDFDEENYILDGITAGVRKYSGKDYEKTVFFNDAKSVPAATVACCNSCEKIMEMLHNMFV